ncbi:MAG: GDP-mannose 4,6-dehydratase [Actinomycetota bacterium]|nr:GDP-mannose 4,6-dehydratase [Actinomycetota bacterium]
MNIIITGAAGFVGRHLARLLLSRNHSIVGIDINQDHGLGFPIQGVDLTKQQQVDQLIKQVKPEGIFHLAAQASVSYSWQNPVDTFRTNVFGGINLLDSVKKFSPGARVLMVCTAEEYGQPPCHQAIDEQFPLNPQNPYAISKAALDFFALTYSQAYQLQVLVTRSFNHIGPGQSDRFVCSDFARQIACIEQGCADPVIKVGNLEAYRDFLDVRDVAAAYSVILAQGRQGEPYNVCSGQKIKIAEILNILIGLSSARQDIKVEIDPNKFRPIDIPSIYGDNRKLKQDTGWQPQYDLITSLSDTLNWWREKVNQENRR